MGEGEAEGQARPREDEALDEQLTEQAPGPGPDGRAHRHLALAPLGAREQQVGDVGARDQQQESDRAEQQQHRGADAAEDLVLDTHRERRELHGLRVEALLGEVGGQCVQLGRDLLDRRARLQLCGGVEAVASTRRVLGVDHEWDPDLGGLRRILGEIGREAKARGHHAHDQPGGAVQSNRPPGYLWIGAVAPLPESVTQNGYVVAALPALFWKKALREVVWVKSI